MIALRMLQLALIVGGGFLAWISGQELWIGMTNQDAQERTCREAALHPPEHNWIRLRECELDFNNVLVSTLSVRGRTVSTPSQVYIALRALGAEENAPTVLVLESENPELLALFGSAANRPREGKPPAAALRTNFGGMVHFGATLDDRAQRRLAEMRGIQPNFIVVGDGEEPQIWRAAGKAIGGILLALLGLILALGGSGSVPKEES